MGKTTVLVESVRSLLNMRAYKDLGVIIFLARREEIAKLVERMGLAREDFAVIVSPDYKENNLGRTEDEDKTLARVLFTTQKRLEIRSRGGKNFADMRDFHYAGAPRQIRVWDEGILPAKPLTLERYDLGALLSSFGRA
jgi:hypothetical protein